MAETDGEIYTTWLEYAKAENFNVDPTATKKRIGGGMAETTLVFQEILV